MPVRLPWPQVLPVKPDGKSVPQAGRIQAAFVRYQPELLSRCAVLAVLRTQPPVRQQCEQVEDADRAVIIEVGRVSGVWSPRREQRQQVEDADGGLALEVRRLGSAIDPKAYRVDYPKPGEIG